MRTSKWSVVIPSRNEEEYFDPYLKLDVHSNDHYYPDFSVPLVSLRMNEITMNAGRFEKFSKEPQSHCTVTLHRREWPKGGSLIDKFEPVLAWIETHATDTWSVDIQMHNVWEADLKWSFANLDDALKFKLSF